MIPPLNNNSFEKSQNSTENQSNKNEKIEDLSVQLIAQENINHFVKNNNNHSLKRNFAPEETQLNKRIKIDNKIEDINDENVAEILNDSISDSNRSRAHDCMMYISRDYGFTIQYNYCSIYDKKNFLPTFHNRILILISENDDLEQVIKFSQYIKNLNLRCGINLSFKSTFNAESIKKLIKIVDAIGPEIMKFKYKADESDVVSSGNFDQNDFKNNAIDNVIDPEYFSTLLNDLLRKCTHLGLLYLSTTKPFTLPCLENLMLLYELNLNNCINFKGFSFESFKNNSLTSIFLEGCRSLTFLPHMNSSKKILEINLNGCSALTNIPYLHHMKAPSERLPEIKIQGCSLSIQKKLYPFRDVRWEDNEFNNRYIQLRFDGLFEKIIRAEDNLLKYEDYVDNEEEIDKEIFENYNSDNIDTEDLISLIKIIQFIREDLKSFRKTSNKKLIIIELLLLSKNKSVIKKIIQSLSSFKMKSSLLKEEFEFENQIIHLMQNKNVLYQWNEFRILVMMDLLINLLQKGYSLDQNYLLMVKKLSYSIEIYWDGKETEEIKKFLETKDGKEMLIDLREILAYFPKIYAIVQSLYPSTTLGNQEYHPSVLSNPPTYKNEVYGIQGMR